MEGIIHVDALVEIKQRAVGTGVDIPPVVTPAGQGYHGRRIIVKQGRIVQIRCTGNGGEFFLFYPFGGGNVLSGIGIYAGKNKLKNKGQNPDEKRQASHENSFWKRKVGNFPEANIVRINARPDSFLSRGERELHEFPRTTD